MSVSDFMQMCSRVSELIGEALRLLKQGNQRQSEMIDLLKQIDKNTRPKDKK